MADRYVWSGAAGAGIGADWANAFITLGAAFAAGAAGDRFFVAHDHSENPATALTLTCPGTLTDPCQVLCVDRAGSVPPVSADLRNTASIITAGVGNLTFNGCAYVRGMTLIAGDVQNQSAAFLTLNATSVSRILTFEDSVIGFGSSGVSSRITAGNGTSPQILRLKNTKMSLAVSTAFATLFNGVNFDWTDTPDAFPRAAPNNLFTSSTSSYGGTATLRNVDLSAMGAGQNIVAAANGKRVMLIDCKLGEGVTVASPVSPASPEVYVVRSDSAGTNYRHEKYYMGTQVVETTIVRTGGAASEGTKLSWRIDTIAANSWLTPFNALPLAVPNSVIGSPVSVTIEGLAVGALPNNDDIWFDVEYLGSGDSPIGSVVRGTKADVLAAGVLHEASDAEWEGDLTGMTKFKQTLIFTAAMKGAFRVHLKAAKGSGIYYVDPKPVIA